MSSRTAIVGAGMAGLIVGRRLARAGDEVVVFEKSRGAGGRTSTRRSEHGAFDHGAQYFTAQDPRFRILVDEWCRAGIVQRWNGPFHSLRRGLLGPDPRPVERYVPAPRMSALARHLASDLELLASVRVAKIDGFGREIRLTTESGDRFEGFDRVIVATPAPQALALLAGCSGFAAIAGRVSLEPCQAVMLTFSEPIEAGFGGAFVEDSPLAWVGSEASKPDRLKSPSYVLHATPQWSREHQEDEPDVVAAALVEAFSDALDRSLPARVHQTAHRWLYARPQNPVGCQFLWDASAAVGVCGDWLCGARVESAVRSGLALADAIELGAP